MKTILPFLTFFMSALAAFAQSAAGDVTAVDAAAGTVTVNQPVGGSRFYRTRPSVEVLINGTKSKLADLAEGMTVKVTSGEPGLATRIEASGTPKAAAPGAPAAAGDLEHRLIGTKWVWWENKNEIQTISFIPNGKAWWSIKQRGDFTWSVVPGENRIEGTAPPRGEKFKMTFDAGLTKGKIYEGGNGRPRDTHLVAAPQTKNEIESLSVSTAPEIFANSRWEWQNKARPVTPKHWVELYENGTGKSSWGTALTWKQSGRLLTLVQSDNRTWRFELNMQQKEGKTDPKQPGQEAVHIRFSMPIK